MIIACLLLPPNSSKAPERTHFFIIPLFDTQVFKHHKEKYLKRREMEEKYNSCPVQTSPDIKIDSPKYIRGFVKRVSSMLTPNSKSRVLMRKGRDYFGSTSSVYINFDSPCPDQVCFVLAL
jgi:hypothetical protein